nr:MAG TPA: Ribosomal protein S12 [Caudoviricetes sp.]
MPCHSDRLKSSENRRILQLYIIFVEGVIIFYGTSVFVRCMALL